ncbi:PaaI family thioesterase [Agaricicola taiwanensis]|uniref:PaaI family thioesterase n=1 Tax=Agaricicola taiwanensis TaxID=591372 RepID=UPI001E3CB3FF|nr:PaaI family thioesterase [Agaricicola taiwanensis]
MQDQPHYSGSAFLEFVGTQLEEWRDGYVRISLELKPHHLNRAGVVHGGLLSTLMDHAGGFCGLWCSVPGNRRVGMTLSMTCNFIAQSKTGVLTAVGERVRGGGKIYFSKTAVYTADGLLVATSTNVHRYRSGSESVEGTPPA